MVHTDKEVKACRMDVDNPAHTGSETTHSKINSTIEPSEWGPVGTQSAFCPRIVTIDTGCTQKSESHRAIYGQLIFHANIGCSADAGSTTSFVTLILQIGKVCQLIRILICFGIYLFTAILCY